MQVTLTAEEVLGRLDPSAHTTYRYWTFNGKVPGPMLRVRQGDTVQVTLRNSGSSHMAHSVDFHAALGPGGGAALSQVTPGQEKTFSFEATTSGLFVYHCGTPMIAEHMANGMYGLILVEPEGGLPAVDHEYYVMQGEIYTSAAKGKEGLQQFSAAKLMNEVPEYFVFNGAVDSLTTEHPMDAKVGETVRVFFGNAGPNESASVHVVGEIFTNVYQLGALGSAPLTGVQTAGVPPGAAAILELAMKMPGKFALMDHAIARMAKGNMAIFDVIGPENALLMHSGPATPGSQSSSTSVSGMTAADDASNREQVGSSLAATSANQVMERRSMGEMSGMMPMQISKADSRRHSAKTLSADLPAFNGCLTLADDGRALLNVFHSTKVYRLEGKPLLFSENANRLVHVSGQFGSVVAKEDPRIPSLVVDNIDELAPNCSARITVAELKKALAKQSAAVGATVGMSDMGFLPRTLVVNAGETVVWRNSSEVMHNVVADPSKALFRVDVKLPSGAQAFESQMLQPGQSFSRTFDVPGVYRYVCTLHEAAGMKGVIIVRAQVLRASK